MTTTTPAQQGTPSAAADDAAPVLTIDCKSLRNVWLPAEHEEAKACAHIYKMYCKASRKKCQADFEALLQAYSALRKTHRQTLQHIVTRGGLLHVGVAA